MRSDFNLSAAQQKNEQAQRILALKAKEHERAVYLANVISAVAEAGEKRWTLESAEEYLARIGLDITKI